MSGGANRKAYAPAFMAAVAAASAKHGTVAEFKADLTAPGNEGGIIQSKHETPGTIRGWACLLVMATPGDDMLTFLVNLAAEMGVHAPTMGGPIAKAATPATG